MEAPPTLQIEVRKGPRKGETLSCDPSSNTRIGRVIKGNHLALRDPGVSQQHLRFEYVVGESSWVVTDLDSSNGTSVNGKEVEPLVGVVVNDGDVIKVGDKTELVLKVEGGVEEKIDRRVSARVRGKSRFLKEEEEGNKEEQKEEEVRVLRNRRNVNAKSSSIKGVVVHENEGAKKDRLVSDLLEIKGGKNADLVSDLGEIEGAKEEKSRVLRGRKTNPSKANEEKKEEMLPNSDPIVDLGAIEKGQKRRGRAKKNDLVETSSKISEEKEGKRYSLAISCLETEEQQEEVKVRRNPRRARVLKDLDINSNKKITRPTKRKLIKTESELESESEEKKDDKTVDLVTELETKKDDSHSDSVLVSDLKNEGERNIEKTKVDFDKMTLGDWFDITELLFLKLAGDEYEQIKNILIAEGQQVNEFIKSGDDQ